MTLIKGFSKKRCMRNRKTTCYFFTEVFYQPRDKQWPEEWVGKVKRWKAGKDWKIVFSYIATIQEIDLKRKWVRPRKILWVDDGFQQIVYMGKAGTDGKQMQMRRFASIRVPTEKELTACLM